MYAPTQQDLAEYQKWLALAGAALLAGLMPKAPDVLVGAGPAHDTPDEHGFVALINCTNPDYRTKRVDVKEVADSLPPGSVARYSAELNLGVAQGRWNSGQVGGGGWFGVCCAIEAYQNDASGATDYRITSPEVDIPNSMSFPPIFKDGFNLGTVAGLTAYLDTLKPATAGPPFPHP